MESGYLTFETAVELVTSIDGTRIYTDAVGHPSNPPIIFIHGYSLSSIVYDNIFVNPAWKERFYLVRLDMRGHGRSDKPENEVDWTPKKFAEDFDSVVAAYQLHKPFIAGWNCGATIIADILAFHPPTSLSGIIYITPIPFLGFYQYIATPYTNDTISNITQTADTNLFRRGAHDFVGALVAAQNLPNPIVFPPRLQHAAAWVRLCHNLVAVQYLL